MKNGHYNKLYLFFSNNVKYNNINNDDFSDTILVGFKIRVLK